jgi:predicted nucleic acid-binding protein
MRLFLFGFVPAYLLSISEITHFECLKVLNPQRAADFREFLKIFFTYPLASNEIALAADLHNFYKAHDEIKKCIDKIDTEDILISATGILSGGYILTQNHHDYPPAFFRCIYKHRLIYEHKSGDERMIMLYLLQPDDDAILYEINRRYPQQTVLV